MSEALLAALDGNDPMAVTSAIRRCADQLRSGKWPVHLYAALLEKLAALAAHESPRPRQAVAEALPYVPDDVWDALHPKLLADEIRFVREAANDATPKRAKHKRALAQAEDSDARVARWFAELDPYERRVAGWIAAHRTEYYVRREHHEIKNLYGPIGGSLDALEKIAPGHPELARLRRLFDRMRRIHEDALENARTVEPQYARVNLKALVASQADELPGHYPDRAERIEVDVIGVDARIDLVADEHYLRQAFGNILRNAVEAYDGSAGRIRIAVSARATGTEAIVTFADQGVGMNEEQMQRAFAPFGSTKPGGTGFGLYNAQLVARQIHGGDLHLASTPGVGTSVTMTLPLRQEPTKNTKKRSRR